MRPLLISFAIGDNLNLLLKLLKLPLFIKYAFNITIICLSVNKETPSKLSSIYMIGET